MTERSLDVASLVSVALLFVAFLPAPANAGPIAPQFHCGDVADPSPSITAGDALAVLRTAVGLEDHPLCAADADGNRTIAATDALRTLRVAVGQSVSMNCPFCCSLCECTPQKLTLALEDVVACDGCIPRVPISGSDVDSVEIEFGVELNEEYELIAVEECVWEATIPGAIAEKVLYGSSVSDCTGGSTAFTGSDVALRVVRTADGWEFYVGQYAFSEGWGDVVEAGVKSGSCEIGGTASNHNETCHLADVGNAADHDTHAVGGQVDLSIADPEPVCP